MVLSDQSVSRKSSPSSPASRFPSFVLPSINPATVKESQSLHSRCKTLLLQITERSTLRHLKYSIPRTASIPSMHTTRNKKSFLVYTYSSCVLIQYRCIVNSGVFFLPFLGVILSWVWNRMLLDLVCFYMYSYTVCISIIHIKKINTYRNKVSAR